MKKTITALVIMTMILILGVTALAANGTVVYGDANGDGEVSNVDIILIARYVVGITDNIDVDTADINGDGEVTNTDLISVARYTVFGRHQREVVLSAGYKVIDRGSDGAVLFFAELSGTEDEVAVIDAASKVRVATLYDNGDGDNGDSVRGDGIYSGYVMADTSSVGELRYYAVHNGYVKSQTVTVSVMEPLTDAQIIDIQRTDDKLGEKVLNADNYVNFTIGERRTLADSVFSELISSGLVVSGSVEYIDANYSYTFTYKCGRPGVFELGEPIGTYLKNGGFEIGSDLMGWAQSGDTRGAYSIGGVIPVKGEAMAVVSAGGGEDVSYISQAMTMPEDVGRLSFYFNMYSEYPSTASQDAFSVEIVSPTGTDTLLYKRVSSSTWFAINPNRSDSAYHTGWEWREYDISRYAGENVTIRFKMTGGSDISRVLLDCVTVSDAGISSCTADEAVTLALSQVGITEWPNNSNNVKYNTAYYGEPVYGSSEYPWCCAFTWWLFDQHNANSLFYGGYRTASCTTLMNYAQENGMWISGTSGLKAGDLILYNFHGSVYYAEHIGIFIGYDENGNLLVAEGNTSVADDDNGGAVMLRVRRPNLVVGAYRPNYADAPTVYDESYMG
jgi:hypothetical protein